MIRVGFSEERAAALSPEGKTELAVGDQPRQRLRLEPACAREEPGKGARLSL